MDIKKKIYYAFDLDLFLSGIILLLFCKLDTKEVEIREIIGTIMIVGSYCALPFIDMEKKEKYWLFVSWHFVAFTVAFFFFFFALNVYVKNPNGAIWWQEILAAIGVLYSVSYISYILINFIRSFYIISSKLISFLLGTNVKETYSSAKKIIEKITALILTITSLAASVTALIVSFSNMTRS